MDLALANPSHAKSGVRIVRVKRDLRDALIWPRRSGYSIGLVPTMGCLHEGHLSLLRTASSHCDVVVMSLFVNPAQFRPGEDLERYPRDEERDLELAAEAGADIVYAPPVEEVYPEGFATRVAVEGITEVLCGDPARRGPEHFHGVTTVVAKLFNSVQPDVAYFGQKDAQQAAAIRRMVRDLDFPLRVEVLPTVREPDGLAMSSRNAYLSAAERAEAPRLYRMLREVADRKINPAGATRILSNAGWRPDYVEMRRRRDLAPPQSGDRELVVLAAARLGETRLIDNLEF